MIRYFKHHTLRHIPLKPIIIIEYNHIILPIIPVWRSPDGCIVEAAGIWIECNDFSPFSDLVAGRDACLVSNGENHVLGECIHSASIKSISILSLSRIRLVILCILNLVLTAIRGYIFDHNREDPVFTLHHHRQSNLNLRPA